MDNIKKEKFDSMPKWLKIIVFTVIGLVVALIFGFVFGVFVMLLWNYIMPQIFQLPYISYLQGVAIFLFFKILIGFNLNHQDKKIKHDRIIKDRNNLKKYRYYDEWWNKEGKQSLSNFAEIKSKSSAIEDKTITEEKRDDNKI